MISEARNPPCESWKTVQTCSNILMPVDELQISEQLPEIKAVERSVLPLVLEMRLDHAPLRSQSQNATELISVGQSHQMRPGTQVVQGMKGEQVQYHKWRGECVVLFVAVSAVAAAAAAALFLLL